MPTTPDNTNPVESPEPAGILPAVFLELRERSRELLRERADELRELEQQLQEQVAVLTVELQRPPPPPPSPPPPEPQVFEPVAASGDRQAALEAEVRHLKQLRHDSELALDEARLMLVEMEDERRALRERLDAAETSHSPPPPPAAERNDEELERLQRRLEMATQEIRELKQQKAELASRPKQSAAPHQPAHVDPKLFDWETQKQRLLQQLETDFDSAKDDQSEAKLQIEDVIRQTDRIVAEKDREIFELRELLAQQQAVDSEGRSSDREQLLDSDEAITTERARLSQLQNEWREKLRKSEVEISIERAKLARERLQLEDKLRAIQVQVASAEEDAKCKPADDSKPAGPPRGRWLTRLGLGGNDE